MTSPADPFGGLGPAAQVAEADRVRDALEAVAAREGVRLVAATLRGVWGGDGPRRVWLDRPLPVEPADVAALDGPLTDLATRAGADGRLRLDRLAVRGVAAFALA